MQPATPVKKLKQYTFYDKGTVLNKDGTINQKADSSWGSRPTDALSGILWDRQQPARAAALKPKTSTTIDIPDGWELWNGDNNLSEYDTDEFGNTQGMPDRVTMYRDYNKDYRQYQVMDKSGKLITGPTLSKKGGNGGLLSKVFKIAAPIAMGALAPGFGAALGGGLAGSVGGGAIAGATAGGLSGGGGKGILKGGLLGGIGGGASNLIGKSGLTGISKDIASGAAKGGIGALVNGGNVGQGLLSGAVGSGINGLGDQAFNAVKDKGMGWFDGLFGSSSGSGSGLLDGLGNLFGSGTPTNSAPGNYSAANDFGSGAGNSNGFNWASLLTPKNLGTVANVAGGINNLFNNPKTPSTPNFTNLAQQQANQQLELLRQQTIANRPNQSNPFGASSWTQNPATGQWSQSTTLNPQDQARLDSSRQIQSGLMGQAANSLSKPLDFSGLPNAQFNMDPTGNNQAVQDATYALSARQRQQQREDEIQRLRSAGLPEDSAAFQRALERLDTSDRMAMNESLLAGRSDYGQSFNRGLNLSQNNQGLRTQGIEEQNAAALSPLQRMQALESSTPGLPQFGNFATAGLGQAPNLMNAGINQLDANTNLYNNKVAQKNSTTKGLFGLGGALGGINFG